MPGGLAVRRGRPKNLGSSIGNAKYGHLPKGGGKEGRGRDGEGDLLRGRGRGGQGDGVIVGLIPAPALRVDE